MESKHGFEKVDFNILQTRLRNAVVGRIQNGEFTERGFARILGISQPQVHNVLKGVRKLSPETADLILHKLDLSVLDLLTDAELSARTTTCPSSDHSVPRKPPGFETQWPRWANGTTNDFAD